MRVLLSPNDSIPRLSHDFIETQPGELLTYFGEPCHQGIQEIFDCGCGRAFLSLQSGERSSLGVVHEMSETAVKEIFSQAIFVKNSFDVIDGEKETNAPEFSGILTMLSTFSDVVWMDLLDISQRLQNVEIGSVFSVKNGRSGSFLVFRKWILNTKS